MAELTRKVTHIRDIRLYNNAGISMPCCYATAKILDMDKTKLPTVNNSIATCKRCKTAFAKRYGWACK